MTSQSLSLHVQPPEPDLPHPLHALSPIDIRNWPEWRRYWDDPELKFEFRLGLLHGIFDLPYFDDREWLGDRICLLLRVADHHADADYFQIEGSHQIKHPGELRNALAVKALQQLSKQVFTDTNHMDFEPPSWVSMVELPGVLRHLVWFFRPRDLPIATSRSHNLVDTRRHGADRSVQDFASKFWRFSWDYGRSKFTPKGFPRELTLDERNVERELILLRPRVLHLAFQLGQWQWLIDETALDLDGDSEEWLLDQALAYRRIGGHTTPTTLEQALANGSPEAQVLVIKHTQYEERQRQEAIRLAEADAAAATARVAALRSGAHQ